MFSIQTLNQISVKGLDKFSRDRYEVATEISHPHAILLRSHKLSTAEIGDTVLGIARAGAGVNNIPVDTCSERGIPVFNTPGANANAVKELVLAALLLGSRGVLEGIQYVSTLGHMDDAAAMGKLLEAEKKRFKGNELVGKTLGVVGLGAIGSMVAEMGLTLGMEVVGYDPALSVEAAWRLPNQVKKIENLSTLLSRSDYVTLHLPVLDATRNLINRDSLRSIKTGARLVNFAREEIVDPEAVVTSLDENHLGAYISDFPHPLLLKRQDVILMPHIGASTDEAEENCAIMAANQLMDYLENGNIRNSVNFPPLILERNGGFRLAIANRNVPKMLGNILSLLADSDINVIDMLNKSRGELAYNLIDLESEPSADLLDQIANIEGVTKVRLV